MTKGDIEKMIIARTADQLRMKPVNFIHILRAHSRLHREAKIITCAMAGLLSRVYADATLDASNIPIEIRSTAALIAGLARPSILPSFSWEG
jgi:hypothetical protein